LIHLGYAFELDNREIAMEALAQIASNYDFDADVQSTQVLHANSSPLPILNEIRQDKRFDGVFTSPGESNVQTLMEKKRDEVNEYYESLDFSQFSQTFKESFDCAVLLLVTTHAEKKPEYDFFLCHALTLFHAVRVLLPFVPDKDDRLLVLRKWWFLVVRVFIAQLRPQVHAEYIKEYNLAGRGWDYAVKEALTGKHALDAHYVKGKSCYPYSSIKLIH
jgi:hypothetical protein